MAFKIGRPNIGVEVRQKIAARAAQGRCSLRLASRRLPPHQLRQLSEVHRHAAGLVLGQPVGGRAALQCTEMSANGP